MQKLPLLLIKTRYLGLIYSMLLSTTK